jgi:hypothetical protein
MMTGAHNTLLASTFAILLALVGAAPPALAQQEGDDTKPPWILEMAPKGGLDDDDREAVATFLADHAGAYQAAPTEIALQVRKLRQWTKTCEPYAKAVPPRLERQLTDVRKGTFRVIFDRALIVVDSDTGHVIDRVEARR